MWLNLKIQKWQNDEVGVQSMEMLKVRAALEEKLKQKGAPLVPFLQSLIKLRSIQDQSMGTFIASILPNFKLLMTCDD